MLRKVLIANRGEIACRIIRTAKRLNIKTVALFSDADRYAKHVSMADQAIHIGGSKAAESYLRGDRILEAAIDTQSEAVHPGYGFLSENAEFADRCEKNKIIFIGPPSSAIRAMGSKSESKNIMINANVPVVPGYHGENQDPQFLLQKAKEIKFPVLIKAVLGGGGKGMRIVHNEGEFLEALESAKREAKKSFNDENVLVERYIEKPRHIEIQVFGDKHGNYVHLFERDCTVQRRHQKVVEEAPSKISSELRAKMGESAVQAARAVGYFNAGTVEFIFDTETNEYFFMEMNTRLQVEHPVTEMISGQDLVEWQFTVASGGSLPKKQNELRINGHAMETRIYSEDPYNNFLPGSGKIIYLREPKHRDNGDPDVRVETGIRENDEVSIFYDPMISKLVVWGKDRDQAIRKMNACLQNYQVLGLPTNIPFLQKVINHKVFQEGEFDTGFIQKYRDDLMPAIQPASDIEITAASLSLILNERTKTNDNALLNRNPWFIKDNFRLNHKEERDIKIHSASPVEPDKKKEYAVKVRYHDDENFDVTVTTGKQQHQLKNINARLFENNEIVLTVDSKQHRFHFYKDAKSNDFKLFREDGQYINIGEDTELGIADASKGVATLFVKSPMPGTIVKLFCKIGDKIAKNSPIISLESMKMEYLIKAERDVEIKAVNVKESQFVQMGSNLIEFAA